MRTTRLRWMVPVAGLAVLMGGISGCTTTIRGAAVPSECARHDLADCAEYVPARPDLDQILAKAGDMESVQQLCSVVDEGTLQRLMGGTFFRYISVGERRCVIAADTEQTEPRFSVLLGVWNEPMAGYSIVEGNQRTEIAGSPAWSNVREDGLGTREVTYTVSTSGHDNTGGVLFVTVRAELPRGQFSASTPPAVPQYDNHRAIAEAITTAVRSLS